MRSFVGGNYGIGISRWVDRFVCDYGLSDLRVALARKILDFNCSGADEFAAAGNLADWLCRRAK